MPNEKVIHSSMREFNSYNEDFHSSSPRIGCIVRSGFHRGVNKVMCDVYWEEPNQSPISRGEILDPDNIEDYLRAKLLELSELCQEQGEELLAHAARLREAASQAKLIDEYEEASITEGVTTKTRETADFTPHRRKVSSVSKGDIDISALNELE